MREKKPPLQSCFFFKKIFCVINKLEGKEGDIYYLGRLLLLLVWRFGIDVHIHSVAHRFISGPPCCLPYSLSFAVGRLLAKTGIGFLEGKMGRKWGGEFRGDGNVLFTNPS